MIVGLTGGFGTGKTTVAKIFKRLGLEIIDADKLVHSLIDDKTRTKLRRFVFNRKEYLYRLNRIVHPLIIKMITERIKKLKKKNVVIDAPLLFETGLDRVCDTIVCVKTKRNTQILRAMRDSRLKREEVIKRIGFQIPLGEKIKRADFVIDNNRTIKETERQVIKVWERLKEE